MDASFSTSSSLFSITAGCRRQSISCTKEWLWQYFPADGWVEHKVHATDASNAARTLLFNIHTQQWDEELLRYFDVPVEILPEVRDTAAHYRPC